MPPIPLAVPLIAAGLGSIGKMVGALKAGRAAKDFRRLEKQVPGAQTEMIGATQSRINANPLAAAAQRRQQTAAANTMYQARQVADQSQMLSMLGGMSGQQERGMLEAQMGDEALRDQRMGQYLNALSTVFDQRMANVQSRAGLLGAAAQTSANAWNTAGGALTDMGSMMLPLTPLGMAANAAKKE